MKPLYKGMVVAVIHVCMVASLGAKLLYDRATLPRVWVKAAPYDPDLPIRGRYVSLRLVVEPQGIAEPPSNQSWGPSHPVELHVDDGRLVAEAIRQEGSYRTSGLNVRYIRIRDERVPVLDEPVAFFIPEHVPDPSRRLMGEQLWVDVTIPKKGIPRPISLGVSQDNGPIVPLDLK